MHEILKRKRDFIEYNRILNHICNKHDVRIDVRICSRAKDPGDVRHHIIISVKRQWQTDKGENTVNHSRLYHFHRPIVVAQDAHSKVVLEIAIIGKRKFLLKRGDCLVDLGFEWTDQGSSIDVQY